MENLPVDILALEILPRLPARTLQQFKCVNKFFNNYISSKKFINLHLHQSASSNTAHPTIVFMCERDGYQCLYLWDDDGDSSARHLPLPPSIINRYRVVAGVCRGLFCLSVSNFTWKDRYKDFSTSHSQSIIVNPSTGKVCCKISLCYSNDLKIRIHKAFGYDSLNDDYKLIELEYSISSLNLSVKVKVYSMKENYWKTIDDSRCLRGSFTGNSVLVENHLPHWLFKSVHEKKLKIVCFDVEKEKWAADVPLPDFEDVYNDRCDEDTDIDLGVLNGCLCLSVFGLKGQPDGQTDVWMMKEYGVRKSWTMLTPLYRFRRTILPRVKGAIDEILIINGDDVVIEGRFVQTYEWYNIRDKSSKKLEFMGAPRDVQIKLLCFPSLVDPGFRD